MWTRRRRRTAKALGLTIPPSVLLRRRSHRAMRRRTFLCGLTLGTLAAPLAAEGQQSGKAARVAVLSPGPGPASSWRVLEAFRQRLRELGYIEGRNLAIEWRFIAGNVE